MSGSAGEIRLRIRGMHCASCVGTVERVLAAVPGVASARVNLATESASVSLDAAGTPPDPVAALAAAASAAGYTAELATGDFSQPAPAVAVEFWRIVIASVLGLPVIIAHMGAHWLHDVLPHGRTMWLWQAVLTLLVLIIGAGGMLRSAALAVLRGSANMDVLVALGALIAFIAGLLGIAIEQPALILFESSVMIVLFVAIGKHIEARVRRRAAGAIGALADRLPKFALRVRDGATETVPVAEIAIGDILRVAAPSAIPVDGEIVSGAASVDESMLTGESLPLEKTIDSRVLGGTLATDGTIDIRCTATGATSAAASIARLVAEAQSIKPPWQRLADRVAAVFVPIVIALATATFAGWWLADRGDPLFALTRAIAVLVIACPCAMGLAIPMAVLVGTTRAARNGILVRDPATLEAAGSVREVLLDKTGTLTIGRPTLARMNTLGGRDESDVLRLAASIEQFVQHPLAQALAQAARARGLKLDEPASFKSQPGAGARGRVNGQSVVIGNSRWLAENKVPIDSLPQPASGATGVYVAIDAAPAAALEFEDTLHPHAAEAVLSLKALGVEPVILSGDRVAAVKKVAESLAIARYEAELTPADKLARIRPGSAMVGDGMNDAPALAAADVGIAIGAGADVAREAADICLVGHDPRNVPQAIRISRATTRIMRQNLVWAMLYNVAMLPLAAFTGLPPALAAAAMMLSSLSVVANSLRLARS